MPVSIAAPQGSHFEYDEVKTKGGAQTLGEVPILVWDTVEGMIAHYTEEGVLAMADGTSARVSFQGIARRLKAKGKTDDEIAQEQVNFRPGKRQGGVSTPESRARRAAVAASEKVGGDTVKALLDQLTSGQVSKEQLEALLAGNN